MSKPFSVEPVKREIIGQQLLTALEDKKNVALVLSEKDLTFLIRALLYSAQASGEFEKWRIEMRDSLEQLREVSFG